MPVPPASLTPSQFDPARILIVRLSHLGDVCHGLPLFHAAREAFPRAEIWWMVQPEFAGLLHGMQGLAGTIEFERDAGWRAWPALRKRARAIGFDMSIDGQGNWKSGMAAYLCGAPVRLGMARREWREGSAARFATHWAEPAKGPHAMQRMQAIADVFAPQFEMRWDLPLSAEEQRAGHELWAQLGPNLTRILHLSVPGDRRSWPAQGYARLAQSLAQAGERVLLLSGPGEAQVGTQLALDLHGQAGIHHLVGQRGLRELAALMSAAGTGGARLLACDSGPSHVAAAVGLGVDLLAGPTDPRATGPWPSMPDNHEPSAARNRVLWDGPGSSMHGLQPKRVFEWLHGRLAHTSAKLPG